MPRSGMRITGTRELTAALRRAADAGNVALAAAGLEEMEKVMAEAKAQTPIDFGVLRDSGHVLPPEIHSGGVEIVMGFGGAASDYAVVQHEDLSLSHTSGNAKFLERPFVAAFGSIPRRLAYKLSLALRSARAR